MDITTKFSNRAKKQKPSSIRELFKLLADPEFISLAGGAPDSNLFPVDKVRQFADEALKKNGNKLLQYGLTEGLPHLREAVSEYIKPRGIDVSVEQIMITTGAQNAIDAFIKTFTDPKDVVALESPSFLASVSAFKAFDSTLVPISLEIDGLNINELETKIKEGIKYLYTIPNYQNPTGITLSEPKRKKLADLAKKYDLLILEDDPYYELNYTNEKLPTLYSLAPENVVYIGSFSKVISPGMRVGFCVSTPEVISKLTVFRQINDVHVNNLAQEIVYKFIKTGEIIPSTQRFVDAYKIKLEKALDIIEREFPSQAVTTRPTGGMFIWVDLPDSFDFESFNKELHKEKVAVVPGFDFYPSEKNISFRINFTQPEIGQLEKGLKIIATVLNKYV